ncbi:MAG: hypothetical protein ABH969_12070 [Pseudomonadota bacterium]
MGPGAMMSGAILFRSGRPFVEKDARMMYRARFSMAVSSWGNKR